MDRVLATRYGSSAADLIANGEYGRMVALLNNQITSVPLADVAGKVKLVEPDNQMVLKAKNMGTIFGD
jgi:6-phosphofructokinase 1